MSVARRIVVTGRVQGVFYRAWTKENAETLGLAGWVRNRRDGSVEALLVGEADSVAAMIARMRQGPRGAEVEGLQDEPAEAPVGRGFSIHL